MKWYASWWGIEISAENAEDETLLKQLLAKLPKEAEKSYEGGEIKTGNKPQKQFIEHIGFTITFNR